MLRLITAAVLVFVAFIRAETLEKHDGYTGVWLRSGVAEVFVATEPTFRVLSFRESKRESIFADSKTNQQGLRLAFMEPEQIPASFDVGNQPATIVERADRAAKVRLNASAGLRYDVSVVLDDDTPVLDLAYTLTNVGDAERRVACWSLISYALDGVIVAPFGDNDRARRRIVLPWWTKWPQPNITVSRSAIAADAGKPIEGNACKVGLTTEPGWIAFARGDRAIVSHVAFDPKGTYPEGNANLTFFFDKHRAETEQVGPLTTIEPGESTQMRETIRISPFTPDTREPDAMSKSLTVPEAR